MIPSPNNLEQALEHHAFGWQVFPTCRPEIVGGQLNGCLHHGAECTNPGKIPLIKWKPLETERVSEDQVREWWSGAWANANMAGVTGAISGIVAGDADSRAAVDEFAENDFDPSCAVVETGKGEQYYFRHTPDAPRNFVKKGRSGAIDWRGEGGMVLLPGSLHKSGRVYRWKKKPSGELPHWPRWIAGLAAEGKRPAPAGGHAQRAIDDTLWEGIPEGERDARLFKAACAMREANVPIEFARALIEAAAERCQPPFEEWEAKVQGAYASYKPTAKFTVAHANLANERAAKLTHITVALDPDGKPFERTDAGNANRLIALHGHELRCVKEDGWYVWDGRRWRKDEVGEIMERTKATARVIPAELATPGLTPDVLKELETWRRTSESREKLRAMALLAESDPRVRTTKDDLDQQHWLLNVANGTLDLQTFALREPRPEDLITKITRAAYNPDAKAPLFEQSLRRSFAGNESMIRFFQKAVGYSLTGHTTERVMFVQHGQGRNGKGVHNEAIRHALGEYAAVAPVEMFMARNGDAGVPNDVARLPGTRYVTTSETEEGKRLAEAQVKSLTGGDRVVARFMRQEFFEFTPTCKFWLATNHKPEIRGVDDGIWDRIRLIPYAVRIPDADVDRNLPEKLKAEADGILAWAVEGCRMWQRDGLGMPPEVQEATGAYREEMDPLADFLQRCDVRPVVESTVRELYTAYQAWCEDAGEKPLTKRRFGMRLRDRGFSTEHRVHGDVWLGVGIGRPVHDESHDGNEETEAKSRLSQGDFPRVTNNPKIASVTSGSSAAEDTTAPFRQRIMAIVAATASGGIRKGDVRRIVEHNGEMSAETFGFAWDQLVQSQQVVPLGGADFEDTHWRRNMAKVLLAVPARGVAS